MEVVEWESGSLANKGDKVKLIKSLRIWKYKDGVSTISQIMKPQTDEDILKRGTEGVVMDTSGNIGGSTYKVNFGKIIVAWIRESNLDLIEDK